MKILTSVLGDGHVRIQVRHGIWPFCWYRTYYGSKDQWKYSVVNGMTFTYSASPRVKARLTRYFNDHYYTETYNA